MSKDRSRYLLMLLSAVLLAAACTRPEAARPSETVTEEEPPDIFTPPADTGAIRYLALGDSYTIGQGVPESARYPRQLTDSLLRNGVDVRTLKIVAATGWTTGDLARALDGQAINDGDYNLVSLLIGVNNQYRGASLDEYRKEFTELLDRAIAYAGGRRERVFVLSIPDYSVTPFGQFSGNPQRTAEEIDQFNKANRTITSSRFVRYFDITPISRQALNDPSLIASDGLHPSGKMYTQWVELMLPQLLHLVKQ